MPLYGSRSTEKSKAKKKKWQLSDDEDEASDTAVATEINELNCSKCREEAALACNACDPKKGLYFCKKCFKAAHSGSADKRDHEIRLLMGETSAGLDNIGQIEGRAKRKNTEDHDDDENGDMKRRRSRSRSPSRSRSRSRSMSRSRSRSLSRSRSRSYSRSRSRSHSPVTEEKPAQPQMPAYTSSVPVFQNPASAVADTTNEEGESRTIFVRNLPFDCTLPDLRGLFRRAGRIVDMRMPKSADGRTGRGIAFVEFDSTEAMTKALEFNDAHFNGRTIGVTINNQKTLDPAKPKAETDEHDKMRFKTKMCSYYESGKTCRAGENCTFAHHPRELQQPPPRPRATSAGGFDSATLSPLPGGHPGGPPGHVPKPGDWTCMQCNNLNFEHRSSCNRCHVPKEGGAPVPGGDGVRGGPPGYTPKPGDWSCLQCNNLNFSHRSDCNRCHAPRSAAEGNPMADHHATYGHAPPPPMGGGFGHHGNHPGPPYGGAPPPHMGGGGHMGGRGGAGPPMGGRGGGGPPMGPGDWPCSSCGNMNYAKRYECNRCHKPKSGGGGRGGRGRGRRSGGIDGGFNWK